MSFGSGHAQKYMEALITLVLIVIVISLVVETGVPWVNNPIFASVIPYIIIVIIIILVVVLLDLFGIADIFGASY